MLSSHQVALSLHLIFWAAGSPLLLTSATGLTTHWKDVMGVNIPPTPPMAQAGTVKSRCNNSHLKGGTLSGVLHHPPCSGPSTPHHHLHNVRIHNNHRPNSLHTTINLNNTQTLHNIRRSFLNIHNPDGIHTSRSHRKTRTPYNIHTQHDNKNIHNLLNIHKLRGLRSFHNDSTKQWRTGISDDNAEQSFKGGKKFVFHRISSGNGLPRAVAAMVSVYTPPTRGKFANVGVVRSPEVERNSESDPPREIKNESFYNESPNKAEMKGSFQSELSTESEGVGNFQRNSTTNYFVKDNSVQDANGRAKFGKYNKIRQRLSHKKVHYNVKYHDGQPPKKVKKKQTLRITGRNTTAGKHQQYSVHYRSRTKYVGNFTPYPRLLEPNNSTRGKDIYSIFLNHTEADSKEFKNGLKGLNNFKKQRRFLSRWLARLQRRHSGNGGRRN